MVIDVLNQGQDSVAEIMSGANEGAFGWVAANYLGGTLNDALEASRKSQLAVRKLGSTIGALDMGGASTQITFVYGPKDGLAQTDAVNLNLYGDSIELYSHSYLCFGVDRAIRRRQALLLNSTACNEGIEIIDPCLPSGFNVTLSPMEMANMHQDVCFRGFLSPNFTENSTCTIVGNGDFQACNTSTAAVWKQHDPIGNFNDAVSAQPSLPTSKMYLFSNFWRTAQFMFLNTSAACPNPEASTQYCSRTLRQLLNRTSIICQRSFSELELEYPTISTKYLTLYCASAVYVHLVFLLKLKFHPPVFRLLE